MAPQVIVCAKNFSLQKGRRSKNRNERVSWNEERHELKMGNGMEWNGMEANRNRGSHEKCRWLIRLIHSTLIHSFIHTVSLCLWEQAKNNASTINVTKTRPGQNNNDVCTVRRTYKLQMMRYSNTYGTCSYNIMLLYNNNNSIIGITLGRLPIPAYFRIPLDLLYSSILWSETCRHLGHSQLFSQICWRLRPLMQRGKETTEL